MVHRRARALSGIAWLALASIVGCGDGDGDDAASRADAGLDGSSVDSRSVDGGEDSSTDAALVDTRPDGGGETATTRGADDVWSPLTVMTVVNPIDHGAIGDGVADDLASLSSTIAALPAAGGIVYFPTGKSFRKTNLLTITRPHVKLWSPNRQATIVAQVKGLTRHQSILCRAAGCGFFGLHLTSDATSRFDALEDNQISIDHVSDVEIVGNEIDGSAAAGIFLYGSKQHTIQGNYVHHTWADHIHHTDGAQASWVWDNFIFNEAPSKGDDGIACVTYGVASPRCGDMEWWHNTLLKSGWGRGYSVIGGDDIAIHDNWAISSAGAGIIVASEPSYHSASSSRITATRNFLYRCSTTIGHPGILVSGNNTEAAPLTDLTFTDNVVVETTSGQAYREEGAFTKVTSTGLSTRLADLPSPIPAVSDVKIADTTVLATRDVSFVDATLQKGLHRIHVRKNPSGAGFQQRFEYVLSGSATDVGAFTAARLAAGDYVSESRVVGTQTFALVLTSAPIAVPGTLAAVGFRELRKGDGDGSLAWLWKRLNERSY